MAVKKSSLKPKPKVKAKGLSPRGQKDPTRRPKAKPTGISPRGQKETPTKSLMDKKLEKYVAKRGGWDYIVKQYAQRKKHPTTPRTR
jgi:hypothetical protein